MKSRDGKSQRREEKQKEDQRRESQKKEGPGAHERRKVAGRCDAKHMWNSKCIKHLSFGELLEVDVEKLQAAVA